MPRPSLSWKQLKHHLQQWQGVIITASTVAGIVLAFRFTGLLQAWEWAALDAMFRYRPHEPIDPAIVIVGINETDLQSANQYPISDALLAKLLNKIKQQQPSAIGLDLYRNFPVEPGSAELTQVFKTTPNLIGIEKVIGDQDDQLVPPPPILKQLDQVGMNDIVPDTDGTIRRALLIVAFENGEWVESLGLKLAQIYLKEQGITPDPNAPYLQLGDTTFFPFQANNGGYVRADDGGYQILINYRGAAHSFPTVSMQDVLQGRIPEDLMRDRIVLISATAPSLKDFFYTPYSNTWTGTPEQMSGVEIQANIASQIINATLHNRPLLHTLPEPIEWLWIILWSGTGTILVWSLQYTRWGILSSLLAGGSLVGICFLVFLWGGWWIPLVPPVLALIGSASITSHYTAIEAVKRHQTVSRLGHYIISPLSLTTWQNYRHLLIQHQGQPFTATVLSIELQNLDRLVHSVDLTILLPWLQDFLAAITPEVLANGGALDPLSGNTITIIFGILPPCEDEAAIAHAAQHALQTALKILNIQESLNQQWQAQGYPPVVIQMGLVTGNMMVSELTMNTPQGNKLNHSLEEGDRLNYLIWGEAITLAAQLQNSSFSSNGTSSRILMNELAYRLNQEPKYAQRIQPNSCINGDLSDIAYQIIPGYRM